LDFCRQPYHRYRSETTAFGGGRDMRIGVGTILTLVILPAIYKLLNQRKFRHYQKQGLASILLQQIE